MSYNFIDLFNLFFRFIPITFISFCVYFSSGIFGVESKVNHLGIQDTQDKNQKKGLTKLKKDKQNKSKASTLNRKKEQDDSRVENKARSTPQDSIQKLPQPLQKSQSSPLKIEKTTAKESKTFTEQKPLSQENDSVTNYMMTKIGPSKSIDNKPSDNSPKLKTENKPEYKYFGKYEFLSIKSTPATLRSGPSPNYKAEYLFTKKFEPVKVLQESGDWIKVQDFYGVEGWFHQNLLSKTQSVIILKKTPMKRWLDNKTIAIIHPMVRCRVISVKENSIYVDCNKLKGYIETNNLWGTGSTNAK